MNNILKAVLFISPVIFLILFYVVSQQNKQDVQMQKDSAQFEEKWNTFDAQFTHDPKQRAISEQKAAAAANQAAELEKEEKAKKEKAEKLEKDLEGTLNDKDVQKKLEKEMR